MRLLVSNHLWWRRQTAARFVDVGGHPVSAPFSHVVEFAEMHAGAAFEASAVPDGYGEALGGVPKPLVSA